MTGFVYAIGDGRGHVKIGWSADPKDRLRQMQTGSPDQMTLLGTVEWPQWRELETHRKLSNWRIRGEWFRLEGAVADFIARLTPPLVEAIPEGAHPLTKWRAARQMSMEELATLVGVTRNAVCRWESGARKISERLIAKVIKSTGIPGKELRPDIYKLLYGEAAE